MGRARIAAAAGAALALTLVLARPALADPVTGTVTAPADDPSYASPLRTGPIITGAFDHGGPGIATVSLSAARDNGIGTSVTVDCAKPPSPSPVDCSNLNHVTFSWTPDLPYNGHYILTAYATGKTDVTHRDAAPATLTVRFALAVPPAAPRALSARASGQDITLNWTGNCEPDLIGYVVSRSSGGAARPVGQVRAGACNDPVSYVDKGAAANGYRYAVQAVRDNGDEDARTAITSDPSVAGPVSPPTTAPAKPAAPSGTAAVARPGAPGTAGAAKADPQFARAGHIDLSGFDALRAQATLPAPDPGYSNKLPFATGRPGAPPEPLRELGPAEGGLGGRRGFLLSAAAGALLFVLALQLRWLAARVAEREGRGPV